MKILSKDEMKKVMGGVEDPPLGCDQKACEAKSNSNLGDCSCNKHGLCLCVKVWS